MVVVRDMIVVDKPLLWVLWLESGEKLRRAISDPIQSSSEIIG